MTVKPFKIIVSGGGPIGLTVAHALSKANIDYVVLEGRDEIAVDLGASTILNAPTMRVMGQLGLIDRMKTAGVVMERAILRQATDQPRWGEVSFDDERENFGGDWYIMNRRDLVSELYDALDDKSKVLTGKRVTEVVSDDEGVEVKCADGSVYEGSLVIGADGIGSAARKAIRSIALKAGSTDVDEERPFLSTFKMLWFSAPRPAKLPIGSGICSFSSRASAQAVVGDELAWFFIYERLDKVTNEKAVYTEKDIEKMIAQWGHLIVDEGLRMDELYATRHKVGLINLDEGVVKNWSGGRIVLVGDSVHKFTPSSALGYNNGVQDLAVALSEIIPLVRAHGNPSVEALGSAFARYKEQRTRMLGKDYEMSRAATRSQTYDNLFLWVLCRLIVPYFGFLQKLLLTIGVNERLKQSRVLDFLPGEEPFSGKIPWNFPVKSGKAI